MILIRADFGTYQNLHKLQSEETAVISDNVDGTFFWGGRGGRKIKGRAKQYFL